MKRIIKSNNGVSNNLPDHIDSKLQDFAQMTEWINYNDIIDFGTRATKSEISELRSAFRGLDSVCNELMCDYYEVKSEDEEAADYIDRIIEIVKG